jgi:uncharacterized membrane protein
MRLPLYTFKTKMLYIVHFTALFLLMLVTGVFWGLWVSLSRSYHHFSPDELAHIGKVIIKNLAVLMRWLSLSCIAVLAISACLYAGQHQRACILNISAIICIVTSLLITIFVEVPINNQVITWTNSTAPDNRKAILSRWQFYNVIRVITAVMSFTLYTWAVL